MLRLFHISIQLLHNQNCVECIYNLRDNWVLELKDSKVVKAKRIHTDLNVAGLFTKCHEWHKMKKLLSLIGLDKEPNLEFRGCLGTRTPSILLVVFLPVLQ